MVWEIMDNRDVGVVINLIRKIPLGRCYWVTLTSRYKALKSRIVGTRQVTVCCGLATLQLEGWIPRLAPVKTHYINSYPDPEPLDEGILIRSRSRRSDKERWKIMIMSDFVSMQSMLVHLFQLS